MPVSVQGQGGHIAAFRAASVLATGFALSEHEALPLLLEWNTQCQPPWKEADLRHKLRSATTSPGTRAPGYLLDQKSSSYRSAAAPDRTARVPRAASGVPREAVSSARQHATAPAQERHTQAPADAASTAPAGTSLLPADVAQQKARQRATWPTFHRPTAEDITAIATQRALPEQALKLASQWGFLKTATVDGHPCHLMHEGSFAQARRLDGQAFTRADGTSFKTKNLPGSEGAFLGRKWAGRRPNVLLVEGCIGLLEAIAAWLHIDHFESCSLLAATSASSRFARDPELLETLAQSRCHVRILPDNDTAGCSAVMSWIGDLRQAGISYAAFPMPTDDCKDLGDILALPDTTLRQQTLAQLFHIP